jgi:hypothetical protein
MIRSVNVTQKVILARVTSGGRKTYVSIKSSGSRVKAFFIGRQGPRGADGAAGGQQFTHTQSQASAEWIVNHNLGRRPGAEILTVGGMVMDAEVVHISVNQLRVYFKTAMAGSVICI